jgi:AAA+ superfamily predicted ATPase
MRGWVCLGREDSCTLQEAAHCLPAGSDIQPRFHGPPGNGKTISIKALMHTLLFDRGKDPIPTLYVRNAPNTYHIRNVFTQARALAPCMLVLEDIETIVTPLTRSYCAFPNLTFT